MEELIDMNVLQPDVLLVSSDDYESYKYEVSGRLGRCLRATLLCLMHARLTTQDQFD